MKHRLDLAEYCHVKFVVTDAALAQLALCSKLTYLDLFYCRHITDAGIQHLSGAQVLEFLRIEGCLQVSTLAVALLMSLKPQLRVVMTESQQMERVAPREFFQFENIP